MNKNKRELAKEKLAREDEERRIASMRWALMPRVSLTHEQIEGFRDAYRLDFDEEIEYSEVVEVYTNLVNLALKLSLPYPGELEELAAEAARKKKEK